MGWSGPHLQPALDEALHGEAQVLLERLPADGGVMVYPEPEDMGGVWIEHQVGGDFATVLPRCCNGFRDVGTVCHGVGTVCRGC